MPVNKTIAVINIRPLLSVIIILLILNCLACHNDHQAVVKDRFTERAADSAMESSLPDEFKPVIAMLVLPARPVPGGTFRIVATGGEKILKAEITVNGPSGNMESISSKEGDEMPCWRVDDFAGSDAGNYKATLSVGKR